LLYCVEEWQHKVVFSKVELLPDIGKDHWDLAPNPIAGKCIKCSCLPPATLRLKANSVCRRFQSGCPLLLPAQHSRDKDSGSAHLPWSDTHC
jgi:hypothetical protein